MRAIVGGIMREENYLMLRVSQANHGPDFDLAEGSHQVVDCRYSFDDSK